MSVDIAGLAITGELLWGAGVLLYISDSLLPAAGETVVLVAGPGGWRCRLVRHPFGAGRHRFVLPNPLLPFALALAGPAEGPLTPLPASEGQRLEALVAALRLPRLLSSLVVVLLFLALPLASRWLGLTLALLLVLPLVYGLNLVQGWWLVRWLRRSGRPLGAALAAASHALLCPPYGGNVARRAFAGADLPLPPLALAVALCPDMAAREVLQPLLADRGSSIDDPAAAIAAWTALPEEA